MTFIIYQRSTESERKQHDKNSNLTSGSGHTCATIDLHHLSQSQTDGQQAILQTRSRKSTIKLSEYYLNLKLAKSGSSQVLTDTVKQRVDIYITHLKKYPDQSEFCGSYLPQGVRGYGATTKKRTFLKDPMTLLARWI